MLVPCIALEIQEQCKEMIMGGEETVRDVAGVNQYHA